MPDATTTAKTDYPKMKTVFHVDLSDAHPGEDHWLHATGRKHLLVPHTKATLAQLRSKAPHLKAFADAELTHYTEQAVEMPAHQVVRVHIKHTMKTFKGANGAHGSSHCAIHCPPPPEKLAQLQASGQPHDLAVNYVSTIQGLVFHHMDLINNDPKVTDIIYDYMNNNAQIFSMFTQVATQMKQMGPPAPNAGWARLDPVEIPANPDAKPPIKGGTYYMQKPTDTIQTNTGPVTTSMMIATKNDLKLKNLKWTQQTGQAVQTENHQENMQLMARIKAGGDNWNASLANTNSISGMQTSLEILDSGKRQVKLTMENTYIRYLGSYIRFYDADGKAISVPTWEPDDSSLIRTILDAMDIQYDDLRFLGYMSPMNNVFAIPFGPPGELVVTCTFPEKAVSASVFGSGLGTGSDEWPKTPIIGGVLTGLLNLGVPAFMLGFAVAAQSYKPLYDIIQDLTKNKAFVGGVLAAGTLFFGAQFGVSAANKQMNWSAFSSLGQLLFNQGATRALIWVEAQLAEGAIEDEIPFAGWIMVAINIATGLAQIAQTIVEVATSPWNIENKVSTSITTNVTVLPDPRHKAFPQPPPATCTVKMIYKDQARPSRSVDIAVPSGSTSTSLTASFPNNTLGGQVKFEADYYLSGWLAGKATTGWIENDETDAAQITLVLVQYPVPLTDKSIYTHAAILTYQNNNYGWQATKTPPTATVTSRNNSSTGNALSEWVALTLSQKHNMIGYAWKAAGMGINSCVTAQGGQLFGMQNIDIPGVPMADLKFPNCGFDGQNSIIYDPYPPKFLMQNGQWVLGPNGQPLPDPKDIDLGAYYLDPRKAAGNWDEDGGYHLRQIVLDSSTPFNTGTGLPSFGRFPYACDSLAIHPSGNIIGVNTQNSKILITPLELPNGANDKDVPLAKVFAGQALNDERLGLLFNPVAVTCSYDGTILVLEDSKAADTQGPVVIARIQAFDLYGNPVSRFFDNNNQPTPFLPLPSGKNYSYLDIAAVGDQKLTYIYVLYYSGDGASPSDYNMGIYQYGDTAPKNNPLVTTPNVAAAKVQVDLWHTVYALNYAMTTDGAGKPAGPSGGSGTGPAGRTVPSVSEWVPPIPS